MLEDAVSSSEPLFTMFLELASTRQNSGLADDVHKIKHESARETLRISRTSLCVSCLRQQAG